MSEVKRRKILKKLKNKYRLVILNDSTFEETLSYRLSPLNVFTLLAAMSIFLILSVIFLIAFTPLREYIPGYTDVNLRKNLTEQILLTDSLENSLRLNQHYLNNVQIILQGGNPDSIQEYNLQQDNEQVELQGVIKSKEDSLLRDYVEREDAYSLSINQQNKKSSLPNFYFFPPLKGPITSEFNRKEEHFGIDIVAPKDEAIKAAMDGTVIFSGWTMETGYVIEIQHQDNLLTIYKHNSVLLKKMGDLVKAGEPIAIVGNSGEYSSGPHLHFEIWHNGVPINPEEYISFN